MTMTTTHAPAVAPAAGFAEPVREAQLSFRAILDALSLPGRAVDIPTALAAPEPLSQTAAAIILTLCDDATPIWLDEPLRNAGVTSWIAFHTGARLVSELKEAAFALVQAPWRLPDLSTFARGSDEAPHTSATAIIIDTDGGYDAYSDPRTVVDGITANTDRNADTDAARATDDTPTNDAAALHGKSVAALEGAEHRAAGTRVQYTADGPGFEYPLSWMSPALPGTFDTQWAANQALFPGGVDLLFVSTHTVTGLPRTTRLTRVSETSEVSEAVADTAVTDDASTRKLFKETNDTKGSL